MTPEELIAFEDDIAAEFEAGKIPHPVHLAGGNEGHLIEIFTQVDKENDWIACSWRSHYHALLKGVPPSELKQAIMDGRSIALCFPDYRMISSAIVGGICPIAIGIAWALKREGRSGKVWCFVGDMTAMGGAFYECVRYVVLQDLPVTFIVEDNGMSVCTPTMEAWGKTPTTRPDVTLVYPYKLTRPHVGINKWIAF